MSSRQQIFMTSGVMIMVVFSMVYSWYALNRANDTVTEVQRLILEGREIGNKRGNATLGAVGETIAEVKLIEGELRDNLTAHRIVANSTNDKVTDLLDNVSTLIKQFNQTNEVERVKAVDKILEGIQNNTELLERLSSITP